MFKSAQLTKIQFIDALTAEHSDNKLKQSMDQSSNTSLIIIGKHLQVVQRKVGELLGEGFRPNHYKTSFIIVIDIVY